MAKEWIHTRSGKTGLHLKLWGFPAKGWALGLENRGRKGLFEVDSGHISDQFHNSNKIKKIYTGSFGVTQNSSRGKKVKLEGEGAVRNVQK